MNRGTMIGVVGILFFIMGLLGGALVNSLAVQRREAAALDSPEKIQMAISRISQVAIERPEPEMRDTAVILYTLNHSLRLGKGYPHRLFESVLPISAEVMPEETKLMSTPSGKK